MTEAKPVVRPRLLGLELPEFLAFVLYCVVQLWMSLVHEAWGDEAQAWLLARDNSLLDLFYRRLHYEGTPGLWHLLLWVETRLRVSYLGMHWITAALAAAGVYLLLRFAPLPRALRLLFPFTFAILYQGPVVARSYLLTLPLLAALCVLRRRTPQRPVLYALLLGLLVNTSALSALLAMGLLVEWIYSAVRAHWRFTRSAMLRAVAITVLLWVAALYSILPAPDAHFGFLGNLQSKAAAARVLAKLTGTPVSALAETPGAKTAAAVMPLEANPGQRVPRNRFQQKLYSLKFPNGQAGIGTHLLRNALLPLSFSLFAISPSNLLGIAFYLALLLWLVKHRALRFALPFALLVLIGPKLYISPHHAMMWWFALLGLIWSAWPSAEIDSRGSRVDIAFNVLLAVVLVQQVVFACHALYFDARYAFDGGKAAEQFVTQSVQPRDVASYTFFPVAMQPYSRTNLFANRPTTYERWKKQDATDMAIETIEVNHPRMVVLGESYTGSRDYDNQIIPVTPAGASMDTGAERRYVLAHGYHETHRFCGDQPIDLGTSERVCQVVYEPDTPAN